MRYGKAERSTSLRATLQPGLSDDVIFLKTGGLLATHVTVPLIDFYSVALAPYQLKGNKVETQTVETDDRSEWLVAVNQENRKPFLPAISSPVDGFNRLVLVLRLHVTDADTALSVFDFFLKTVHGDKFRSHVVEAT